MKTKGIWLVALGLTLCWTALPAAQRSGDLRITSVTKFPTNAVVAWTYPTNGVDKYRLEGAGSFDAGAWTNDLDGIAPTGPVMSVSVNVPTSMVARFYAVAAVTSVIDTNVPNVSNLAAVAGNGKIRLTWQNPTNANFAGVKMQRKTVSYPANPTDGINIYSGTDTSLTNRDLINGTTYYYAAFSYDNDPSTRYSTGVTAAAMPSTTPPPNVSNFVATAGDEQVTLAWRNPTDSFIDGVWIQRQTGGNPTSPTDGTTVYTGNGTNVVDAWLTNGTTYYYTAFSYDGTNYAGGATGAATPTNRGNYLLVDLFGGPLTSSYQVIYLTDVPAGGWTDGYKTTNLVLRRIPSTTRAFTMGSPADEIGHEDDETQHQVTLTQPFYLGVFEVTQKQWERVMGNWPSYFTNASCRDSRPVEQVAYDAIRGSMAGTNWPASSRVDDASFLGTLRTRTGGMAFDLPTEAQWEYAGRAGTTTALNSGKNLGNTDEDVNMDEVGRYVGNSGGYSEPSQDVDTNTATATVGSYLPNTWGLYDMHGNVCEWCLDWYEAYPDAAIDPKGAASGADRVLRGGSWAVNASQCRAASRASSEPASADNRIGFRVVLSSGQTPPPPTNAPANVSGFVATPTEGQISLTWQNPPDRDFAAVRIRRKTEGYPADLNDGAMVYNSNGTNTVDTGLTNGTAYYYRAFSYNTSMKYAGGVTATATPQPVPPAGFVAMAGNGRIRLTWQNAMTANFAGVKIQRKTVSYPANPTDGVNVYNGAGTSTTNTGLINGTTYYYTAFSYDNDPSPHYSTGVTAATTPSTNPPPDVSNFAATAGDEQITLAWQNPSDVFIDGVRIQRKTVGYPTDQTDGITIYNGNGTNAVDAWLTNGTTYYYTAFSYDGTNYAGGATGTATPTNRGSYLVVDLSGGPLTSSYPVIYLTDVPAGGWTDEYKTRKLVLRRIPATARSFAMGSPTNEVGREDDETRHQVTLTQPFYLGVFEVTQKQWERVTGNWPSYFTNASCRDSRPVEQVAYDAIRGSMAGTNWPASSRVDDPSFLGTLRARTGGMAFELPTEAQWEYAGRAGTTTALNSGKNLVDTDEDVNMGEVGRYVGNSHGYSEPSQDVDTNTATATVGSYLPNTWGLYDIHGNVWEWCLDWYEAYPDAAIDPKGAASGADRVLRGGSWAVNASQCRAASRASSEPASADNRMGFRVVLSSGQTPPPPTNAPANVSGFAATPAEGQISLTWTNPPDGDFAGVRILRKTEGYPADLNDGAMVYNSNRTNTVDAGLICGTQYYYRAFSYNTSTNYASGVTTTATTLAIPPANVSHFEAEAGNGQVTLTWQNPTDADFKGVKIQRKEGDYPTSQDDGWPVYDWHGTNAVDTGVSNGTPYYYRAFSYDAFMNYASGAMATATPQGASPSD